MTITRTRISIGSQIRGALDAMVTRGDIKTWRTFGAANDGRELYEVEGFIGNRSLGRTPGEMIDYLNARGFDIRFGKVPRPCEVCGASLTSSEVSRLEADIDFVEHGSPKHLIRVIA